MFGLMRFNGCNKTDEELYRRRLLYCGTCKAIGADYGQSARMLLNNDVVFLAEILQAISTEPTSNFQDWAQAFQSYNCMSLPDKADVPTTLRIAASVSMILSELKLDDHIDDSGSLVSRGAKKYLGPAFTKSESEFSHLAFPLNEIRKWFDQQSIREKYGRGRLSEHDSLSMFAEPTAMITAIVFQHSGSIVSGDTWNTTMHRLGFGFGKLIYLLDAFEDYARDFRSVSFNAIASAYDLKTVSMPSAVEESIERQIRRELNELDQCIAELPLASEQKQEYSDRLWRNVRRKSGFKLTKHRTKHRVSISAHLKNQPSCSRSDNSLQSRWTTACTTAANLTSDLIPSCESKLILAFHLTYRATIYLFVLFVAYLSPVQSRSVRNYRECVELPFNLMFWGAAVATIISSFIQAGNKSFAYAHAMVGGNGSKRPPHDEFSEPTRLSESSPEEEQEGENRDGKGEDAAKEAEEEREKQNNRGHEDISREPGKPQKGINNAQFRRSRAHSGPMPVPMCFCCDCSSCTGGGECCECCCEGSECCEADCCCSSCGGTAECCTCGSGSAECCSGGSLECCSGADCCAGGECCSGGCDCCAGGGDACAGGADCCGGCFS